MDDFYKVIYTKDADRDSDDIFIYLYAQSVSQRRAFRFVAALRAEISRCLSFRPQGYRLVDDDVLAAKGLHKLIVKNYLAFFTVDEENNTAYVERIIHGRRDWATILMGNDEEN